MALRLTAVDQHGQIIDVQFSARGDTAAATRFFIRALRAHGNRAKVTTEQAHALALAVEAVVPQAWDDTEQYANNRTGSNHARLKARLRPMRSLSATASPK